MPFWVATLFDRAFILLLPVVGIIFPLFRIVPAFYNWRMRQRILRWYRALKHLERDLAKNAATPEFIERKEKELDLIEQKVWRISVPDQFAPDLYTLRDHVEFDAGASRISGRGSKSQVRSSLRRASRRLKRLCQPIKWRTRQAAESEGGIPLSLNGRGQNLIHAHEVKRRKMSDAGP